MKKTIVMLSVLTLTFAAQAQLEVQINGSAALENGSSGNLTLSELGENDQDTESTTSWSLGGEVYRGLNENLQLGGLLAVSDSGLDESDTNFTLGALLRYNLDSELRNSMFFGGGLAFTDYGEGDSMSVVASFGKRYALSDAFTYTPNVSVLVPVAGDVDGHRVSFNFISFSGFLNI